MLAACPYGSHCSALYATGPASGYDLAKSFERSLNHVWQAGHTQIYPELVRWPPTGW